MSCCGSEAGLVALLPDARAADEEVLLASRIVADGVRQTDLSVPAIHCGACIRTIEKALGGLAGVESARVNLSTRRVTVRWRADGAPPPLIETLEQAGFQAHLFDFEPDSKDGARSELVRALAVAGFAASNIMLLSVSVWAGAEAETRNLFHWLSAIIALPALAYSGRVFFRSAWQAVRHGRTNMDVPISLGVLLAFGMSFYETVVHGPHAYFDAAISLLFVLLVGRTLDHMVRERARLAVKGLAQLSARGAFVLQEDGTQRYLPTNEIRTGMTILLAAGERVPVDATVTRGASEMDVSLVSGEHAPVPVAAGSVLRAGTLNLTGPLTIVATATSGDSFLGEMVRMMEAAEQGRSGYRRIADRAASLYAPAVHLTALMTFVGWLIATADVHHAMTIAIAVLIITCPCALGLAVPMVQVVAARRLFDAGIMVKDGGALERLAEADTVVFDKTGTLTVGVPRLVGSCDASRETTAIAAGLASHSRHPYSRALVEAGAGLPAPHIAFDEISEHPGYGLEARSGAVSLPAGPAGLGARRYGRSRLDVRQRNRRARKGRQPPVGFSLRGPAPGGRGNGGRRAKGYGISGSGDFRRSRNRGTADRSRARCSLPCRRVARRQDHAHCSARSFRPQGPDGRRRIERRAGAGGRACIDGAGFGGRRRTQRRRYGFPA